MLRIKHRRLLWLCFICYCMALLIILFFRNDYGYVDFSRYAYWDRVLDKVNLMPFSTLGDQLRSIAGHGRYTRLVALRNLAANMMLFVPMGLFLPLLMEHLRRFRTAFALWCGLILGIETAQLLTLQGSFDIDDVILNTLGFLAGYCIYALIQWIVRHFREEK